LIDDYFGKDYVALLNSIARKIFILIVYQVKISQTQVPLCYALGTIGKPLMNKGAPRWFDNV
jgi:hypothetical protein